MVSGSSQTSMLTLAGNFLYVYLQVPTMTGGYAADTKIMLQVSGDGSTFYRFSNPENNTNTVGTNDFQIVSSATQRMICVNNFCFPYLKVETTAVATAGVANNNPFKLICVSNQ
jgi:hypothetical protein